MLNSIMQLVHAGTLILELEGDQLVLVAPKAEVERLLPSVKPRKEELVRILRSDTVNHVGVCDVCAFKLVGFSTFDGYVNRVCPECDKWFQCLDPSQSLDGCDEYKREDTVTERTVDACISNIETELS